MEGGLEHAQNGRVELNQLSGCEVEEDLEARLGRRRRGDEVGHDEGQHAFARRHEPLLGRRRRLHPLVHARRDGEEVEAAPALA